MQIVLQILLDSIRSALELGLFVLLPVMVVMLALMKVLEAKGVLDFVARLLSPLVRVFGLSGLSVIAALQTLFVSFAAPPTTLALMVQRKAPARRVAATLAMILVMSQANATFPLTVLGLNLWATWVSSVLGGLVAAALTYYLFFELFFKPTAEEVPVPEDDAKVAEPERRGVLRAALDGAQEGARLVLKSMPKILLAIVAVNCVVAVGALSWFESIVAPALHRVGLSGVAVLPVVTKYLAGGTAMMGATIDLLREGTLSVTELNRIAGFTINPFDIVGFAVLAPAVAKIPSVMRSAIPGAIAGILARGVLHLLFF